MKKKFILIKILNFFTGASLKEKDFDLYFKKDIPIGMLEKDLYPLAPDPIKVDNFQDIKKKPFTERENTLFLQRSA